MSNKKEQSVDSILAAAGAKMAVNAPPTGSSVPPIDNGQQFDFAEPPITGPIDFGSMKPLKQTIAPLMVDKGVSIPPNEDAKYGKAFNIATKTISLFKVEDVKSFIQFVEKVKESL